MSQIDLRFRAKDLRDDPEQMKLLLGAIQLAKGGRAQVSVLVGAAKVPSGRRDPELEHRVVRQVEKVLADESARVQHAQLAVARIPDVRPRPAEDIVRETEGELHCAIGQLLVRALAIAARVVEFGITVGQHFP